MNKVFLIGRLTRDPELKFTPTSGNAVATFTLAVDRSYKNSEGKYDADFINIVVWRKLAEHVANNLAKGNMVSVSGTLQTRKYQAQDGSNRYVTEVISDEVKFIIWNKDNTNNDVKGGLYDNSNNSEGFFPTDDNTEIPF